MPNMKKIMAFVMFVLMLAQVAGVAHAFADSFHASKVHDVSISAEPSASGNKADTSDYPSEHKNCSQNCHGHSHFYINTQVLKVPVAQKEILPSNKHQMFTGLIHGPDSPPPNIL